MRESLALHLIDSFIDFLKGIFCPRHLTHLLIVVEPVLPDSVAPYLTDALLSRLLSILYDAKPAVHSLHSNSLTWRCFEAILEASLNNVDLWALFKEHIKRNSLLGDLLIEEPRMSIRKSVAKQIITKCTVNQRYPLPTHLLDSKLISLVVLTFPHRISLWHSGP